MPASSNTCRAERAGLSPQPNRRAGTEAAAPTEITVMTPIGGAAAAAGAAAKVRTKTVAIAVGGPSPAIRTLASFATNISPRKVVRSVIDVGFNTSPNRRLTN